MSQEEPLERETLDALIKWLKARAERLEGILAKLDGEVEKRDVEKMGTN